MSYVEVTLQDGLARVVLSDPGTLNAIGVEMARQLRAAFIELEQDAGVRAVLLSGAGSNFSSGGNLSDALELARQGQQGAHRFMAGFNALIHTVYAFPKPIVGAVRGCVVGGALGLLLCTDVILMSRSAKLMQAFIHIGLAPDCGTSVLLASRVGSARARELTLTGRQVDAGEALRIGLADALYEEEELVPRAEAQAVALAGRSPLALIHSKKLMRRGQLATLEEALELEAASQVLLLQSGDFLERASAFVAKRRGASQGTPS